MASSWAEKVGVITIRLRTKDGTERVQVPPTVSKKELLAVVAERFSLDEGAISVTRDGPGRERLQDEGPIGVSHGDMLFLNYSGEREAIDKYQENDPFKKLVQNGELRKQGKSEWTLTNYLEFRADREYKLVKPPDPHASHVSVDAGASNAFLVNMQSVGFACQRMGVLFGRYVDDGGVQVDAIYEPAQECTDSTIRLSEDVFDSRAFKIAELLGLEMVGWIFAHPPRAFAFTINEIILASELHAKALDREKERAAPLQGDDELQRERETTLRAQRFVTLKARMVHEGEAIDGVATVEAYQMTDQCIDLVRKEAFKESRNDPRCAKTTNSDCYFVIEQKESRKATAEHFVSRVHDMSRPYSSPLRTGFPGTLLPSLAPVQRHVAERLPVRAPQSRIAQRSRKRSIRFAIISSAVEASPSAW